MNILISDSLSSKGVEVLERAGFSVAVKTKFKTKLSKDELLKEIANYEAIIVRSATKVTKEVIEAGGRLRIVGRAGTGLDNVDTEAATRRGRQYDHHGRTYDVDDCRDESKNSSSDKIYEGRQVGKKQVYGERTV